MKRSTLVRAAAAAACVVVSGCGSSRPGERAATPSSTRPYAQAEWVTSYDSLGQLARDSTLVVRGRVSASSAPEVVPAAEPGSGDDVTKATVLTFDVEEVIAGTKPNGSVRIQQLGTVDAPMIDPKEAAWLEKGRTYVLYLEPFTYGVGKPATGRFFVDGGLGAFVVSGSALSRTTTRGGVDRRTTLSAVRASAVELVRSR